ncbi:MAG: RNA polymerase sigma factor [Oscillospiraceae bacterium]|nr:RNA polymerase sigma factor [Oscillospiraceae bacterium]
MQDDDIVTLYWQRDETAIQETQQKYGRYLLKIAYQILLDLEDGKESVNDTYLKAWNSIPPHKPLVLPTYLGKITRQTSIDLFRKRNRKKRQASQYAVSLCELEECAGGTTEQSADLRLLAETIERYLATLTRQARSAFVGRYYFMDPLKEVAAYCGMSESKAKSMLYRTRQGLKSFLEQEGFAV